jgi:hypothetical protein
MHLFREKRRNPLSKDLLRSPGESLRKQIDDINWDLASLFAVSALPGITLYALYASQPATESVQLNPVAIGFLGLAAQSWILFRIWTQLKRRRQLVLGYEAELAVGQELNQLMRHQFHVFHDLPAKNDFNVDHIVVGTNGVFAVETKGRSKPAKDGKAIAWEVSYDGTSLLFPGWTETKPLQQARNQAKWVREWLSSAVGEPVAVQAVLILPGWFIRRTSGSDIPVLSGREADKYFPKFKCGVTLSEQLIQRIVHQLDQRCRDVTPQAYGASNNNK